MEKSFQNDATNKIEEELRDDIETNNIIESFSFDENTDFQTLQYLEEFNKLKPSCPTCFSLLIEAQISFTEKILICENVIFYFHYSLHYLSFIY